MPRASSSIIGHSTLVIPRRRRGGFALLITITLLAFLVLLLVSLASLTRVETQVASNNQNLAQARQNALFALNIALGQLQKSAGPDQRVTARAEVGAGTIENPLWTGVWGRTSAPDAYLTSANPSTATTGAVLNWLISGNDTVAFTADAAGTLTPPAAIPVVPTSAVANLQGANPLATNMTISVNGTARPSILLVGDKTARPADPAKPSSAYVAAPLVDINTEARNLPGFSSTDTTATRVGRYAWWVGDEGVKARGNLPAPATTPTATVDKLNRVRLAQRAAVELFDDDTTSGNALKLPPILDPKLDAMGRLMTPGQLALLAGTPADATVLGDTRRLRYHDFTTASLGVQADAAKGGLKMDLSTAFEMTDALFDASDLGAAGTDRVLVRGITPNKYATFTYTRDLGTDAGDTTAPAGEKLKLRGPTWQALRSHYRLYTSRNLENSSLPFAATAAIPNASNTGIGQNNHVAAHFNAGTTLDSNTHDYTARPYNTSTAVTRMISPGVAPYINRITVAFGLRTELVGLGGGGQPIYRVLVVMTPFVVLHNPYNVPLELRDLDADNVIARIHTGSMPFRMRIRANGYSFMPEDNGTLATPIETTVPQTDTYNSVIGGGMFEYFCINQAGRTAFNDGANSFRFELPPATLAPGALQIFSPEKLPTGNGLTEIGTPFLKLRPNATYDGGYYLSRLNGAGYPIWYMGKPTPPVLCPTGPGNAATRGVWQPPVAAVPGGGTGNISDIWVPGDMPITLEMNPEDWGFYYRYRYVMESAGSADRTSTTSINNVSFLADLQTRMVQAYRITDSPSATQTNLRAYTGFTQADVNRQRGGQQASAYAGQTVYLYAMDVYTKPADNASAKVARPFVTSNPMALVQNYNALGENNGYGRPNAGFPTVMPHLQVDHIDLNNGSTPLAQLVPHDPDTGNAFWGSTKQASGQTAVKLIEIPSRPLASLAEFQNANLSLYGYQPYFTAGNSYALPHIPADRPTYNAIFSSGKAWTLYDSSFFLNEALWDSTFFSTLTPAYSGSGLFGQTAATALPAVITAWQAGTARLPNPRMLPYASASTTTGSVPLLAGAVVSPVAHRTAAASVLTAGSFNINSRSVDAWTAVLAGARKAGMVTTDAGTVQDLGNDVAVPRFTPNAVERDTDPLSVNSWTGFARLTPANIRALAERLVAEITTRQSLNGGRPFLSLAEFINRALRDDAATRTGYSGALQSALDATVNSTFDAGNATQQMTTAQSDARWPFRAPRNGTGPAASTALGFLLQADVLQQIGPQLAARSDTFTIRTYGEVLDPINSTPASPVIQGRAWCEAVVQRLPDFIDQADPALTTSNLGSATPLASVNAVNAAFGRRFKVVSFRWLSAGDI